MIEYVATLRGANAAGSPTYRVVTDGLTVVHVAVPYARSTAPEVNETITHALTALRRPPKPVR